MLRFLMQRLLALVPVLFTVAVIVFLILRLTPGDPAALRKNISGLVPGGAQVYWNIKKN